MKKPQSVLVVLVLAMTGCYQYAPIRPSDTPPGVRVRAWITPEQAETMRLREVLPASDERVEGSVVSASSSAVELLVPVASPEEGIAGPAGPRQRLVIPVEGIVQLEVRSLNRRRTALLVLTGAALFVGILWTQGSGWFGGSTEPVPIDKI
ncbi:MAG: hypothetical protein GEU90_06735 [Gemmatimonas sp.]|nr:hypothetical protein [Gemmatimonas sp.]